ncbi:hypothetical protein [Candidatus Bandiella euplotis]|uniref:DUF748 domain-containing protein n=1 Tax=Candidatus Bandiella euplotis TaxID=1664265 RepID=A0ABZ0UNA4_9RICK|nr:hypothetical protein [Candidatus Bandiella woodruffii]WPX96573.1 hypothetical protein Bandiella_00689 [Candidatus Bandiella woodruffii]
MKKKILWISTACLLIGVNFVLRYMHINKIEETIDIVSDKLLEHGLKLTYDKISYGNIGFWNVSARMVKPVFLQERQGFSDKSSVEYIDLTHSLITKSLKVESSDKINTLITDANGEQKYSSTFTSAPAFNVKLKGYLITQNEFLEKNRLERYFIKYVDELNYTSSGHITSKVEKDDTVTSISSVDNFTVKLTNQSVEDHTGFNVKFNSDKAKYFSTPTSDSYAKLNSELGEISLIGDLNCSFDFKDDARINLNEEVILADVKPVYKLHIDTLKLTTQPYSFQIDGDMVLGKTQMIPFFDLKFGVVNYTNLLNFYFNFYNTLFANADIMRALSLGMIQDNQKAAVIKLFEKVASKSQNDKYELRITQLKEAPMMIGTYSFDEVAAMYNKLIEQKGEGDTKAIE